MTIMRAKTTRQNAGQRMWFVYSSTHPAPNPARFRIDHVLRASQRRTSQPRIMAPYQGASELVADDRFARSTCCSNCSCARANSSQRVASS